ncbi:type I-G CRISPR-associated RAMP protein Csb1/Cas7g [Tuwongella immobilis]|uniref:Type I-U CRISPR-associated protein Cas7 n=1 Tax=Tuwongella immobilis TaxID=692036 RepID=A0A6C2YLA8_9BACT|nr:type I-U CRISPR-associated RAMP protein Csb1/Cas7u [Tuwongella immobilis]VIP01702.1 CRISPR-associated protein, GSU0053 family OS=Planctomyces limnophilus (strain ATCC 43296 / DSM 3776 / IFAM 1008 / 290) GN=Plim_3149 PE=4 SV=1: Cas_GSU0053 [Tuwongella immobilis]VTR99194.1 CRISPR-associated protein, GSU0053 family OS=Planctomyces limnophilus (strain ATCC 43296 / DSM 3776 / IFAM 1008 / 290) GN=Plim_3149 PE=4 SV=1: Cas_GSU0053 [Tuwongella immobilis]
MSQLKKLDRYLSEDGPAALVIREALMPVDGPDGVLFPATFAAGDGFPGGYNIDIDPRTGKNVALIDSVGSQANRIEPLFGKDAYRHLVPQVAVTAGEKTVSILEAGHRAGDALLRCSSLGDTLRQAFQAVLRGDATPMAKIAPTSLVFGVWDSRDTQAKLPRLVASTIRAFEVRKLTRGAVYTPPLDYAAQDVFSEEEKAKAEGDSKNPLAKRGFVHVPASGSHGGVIADGGVRRDATLSLAALRMLHAGTNADQSLMLRRYILGLALVALTAPPESYLRQGCMLVKNPAGEHEFVEVMPSGEQVDCKMTHADALAYATEAAKDFGVGDSQVVPFDREKAKKDVKGDDDAKPKGKKGAK